MATKHIEETPALNRAGAYVIIDERREKDSLPIAGKILVAYPKDGAGILRASLWDFTWVGDHDVQDGAANGCGYDKLSAALHGMHFGCGDRGFDLDCNGRGIEVVRAQFAEHGYLLQWVV